MKYSIDTKTWERRENWQFMLTLADSWYSITSEVDCTKAFEQSKAQHTSFFIKYLYAMMRAANEVKEFGYRSNKEGGVDWFDRIDATVPVAVPGKTFYTALVKYKEDYREFYDSVKAQFSNVPEDGDPYGVNKQLIASGEIGVVNISAIPRLYFTSMTYTSGNDWPLMNVGKAVRRGDRWVMPVGICVDHAFVDGNNLADFLDKMQHYLDL